MPVYEYRCLTCDAPFEQRRAIGEAAPEPRCPAGHTDVRRVFSVFAASRPASEPVAAGGGCCGGACGCG